MIKPIPILGLILFALIFGCAKKQNATVDNKYILNGELEGIDDGTWIYLMRDAITVDSAQVAQNKFSMVGVLEQPQEFNLLIKNTQNFSRIWLEPKTIAFYAKNGEFKTAKISGSKTHAESENLWQPIWDYRKRRDSLSKVVSNDTINDSLKAKASLELDQIWKDRLKIERDFIKNNPNSYVSAQTLDFYTTSLNKKTVAELYNNFSEPVKTSTYGQSIQRFLELYKNIKVGDHFADFSMANENNDLVKLSDFEGKLILLDFWASWCGPCKAEYPALKEAYAKFSANGFEIISISEDRSREDWINAIEANGLHWENLWEENGNNADPYLIYGINGIPDNFLINKKGIIVARDLRGEKLMEAIAENL